MAKLDDYERELLESYENDEWESVKDKEAEIKRYRQYAASSLKKDKKISIRITSKDLEDIKMKAIAEGLNEEVLIASIIHKYNTGKLIEK
jgi:predicted DNA binding CopG/RHH family protein